MITRSPSLRRDQSGSIAPLLLSVVMIGVVAAGLQVLGTRLEQSQDISERSRAHAAAYAAIDSAINTFSTLLDGGFFYICGYSVPVNTASNQDSSIFVNMPTELSSPLEPSPWCNSSRLGRVNVTYPIVPGVVAGRDWSWDEPSQTFSHKSCYGKVFKPTDLASIYSSTAPDTIFSTCQTIPTTLTVSNSTYPTTTLDYFIISGNATVTVDNMPLHVTVKVRLGYPNSCNPGTATAPTDDFYTGFSSTLQKKPKKIKKEADWRKIIPGGNYEVDVDVDAQHPDKSLKLGKNEIDFTQRPLKNVAINGKRDDGNKIRDDDDPSLSPVKDNVGVFGDLTCSTVLNTSIVQGDPTVDQTKGQRQGKKCVGGLVGIVRRGLVSNSKVVDESPDTTAPSTTTTSARHIKGVTGSGAVIGCLDNPAFWHSRATAAFADAVIETMANPSSTDPVVAGGIVGISKGQVDDSVSNSTLMAYLVQVAPSAFGGIAGMSLTDQALLTDVHTTPNAKIKEVSGSGGSSKPVNNVGGIVGAIDSGPQPTVSNPTPPPAVSKATNEGSIDVTGNHVGGIIGLVGADDVNPPLPASNPQQPVTVSDCHVDSTGAVNSGKVKGGDDVGGLVGAVKGNASATPALALTASYADDGTSVVSSASGKNTGGLIGSVTSPDASAKVTVTNCFSLADATPAGLKTDAAVGSLNLATAITVTGTNATFINSDKTPGTTTVANIQPKSTATISAGTVDPAFHAAPFDTNPTVNPPKNSNGKSTPDTPANPCTRKL